jgi:hypothetical protein
MSLNLYVNMLIELSDSGYLIYDPAARFNLFLLKADAPLKLSNFMKSLWKCT